MLLFAPLSFVLAFTAHLPYAACYLRLPIKHARNNAQSSRGLRSLGKRGLEEVRLFNMTNVGYLVECG